MCLDSVEQGAQHTALGGTGVDPEGCGLVRPYSDSPGAVCQEVKNPDADRIRESKGFYFGHQSVGEDGVKGGAEVCKQQPHVAPRLFQVGQGSVESGGDGLLRGSFCPVRKLVTIKYKWEEEGDVTTHQFLKALHDDWR